MNVLIEWREIYVRIYNIEPGLQVKNDDWLTMILFEMDTLAAVTRVSTCDRVICTYQTTQTEHLCHSCCSGCRCSWTSWRLYQGVGSETSMMGIAVEYYYRDLEILELVFFWHKWMGLSNNLTTWVILILPEMHELYSALLFLLCGKCWNLCCKHCYMCSKPITKVNGI